MNYTCSICGGEFISYNPRPQYCGRRCKSQAQQLPIDTELVASLYKNGLSQAEVAVQLGVTQKVVFSTLRRSGVTSRTTAKRNQRGSANSTWGGDGVCYAAFHYRVKALHGTPKQCEVCGTTDPDKHYDWANLTGHYEDVSDYARMCRSCHRQYDNARRAIQGQEDSDATE